MDGALHPQADDSPPRCPSLEKWKISLPVLLAFCAGMLGLDLTAPWHLTMDYNAVAWAQAAHNHLRAGLLATHAVPASFYYGPLPIPAEFYYLHHPPLLPLALAGVFAFLGEHEWVARLLPIGATLVSVVLLWLLVRNETGPRVATFSAALFVATPMVLHYGHMVNFEPCVLAPMLLAALSLRKWQAAASRTQWALVAGSLVLAMWTAWMGYFFALVGAGYLWIKGNRSEKPLGTLLVAAALFSALLFILQITSVNPLAWQDISQATVRRVGIRDSFGWSEWLVQVSRYLVIFIPPLMWVLALAGAFLAFRSRETPLKSLGWLSAWFAVMTVLYMVGFRNASYIHEYSAYFLVVSVAILGGVALDRLIRRLDAGPMGKLGVVGVTLLLVLTGISAGRTLNGLRQRALYVLSEKAPEPRDLAALLGSAIQKAFPEDTTIYSNMSADFLPLLSYYAQRTIIPSLGEAHHWSDLLAQSSPNAGGLIWLGAPEASRQADVLPSASRQRIIVAGQPFCLWRAGKSEWPSR